MCRYVHRYVGMLVLIHIQPRHVEPLGGNSLERDIVITMYYRIIKN